MRPSRMALSVALALGLALTPTAAGAQEAPVVPPEPQYAALSIIAAIPLPLPQPAVREAVNVCVADPATCNPPTTPPPPPRQAWRYCEQWHDLAADVGWPESAGPTLSYVMHRESGCNPNAYNPSGATGLLQLLGWRCDGGCRNPRGNLKKGLELWQSSGWRPWCLNGDPVTGHC